MSADTAAAAWSASLPRQAPPPCARGERVHSPSPIPSFSWQPDPPTRHTCLAPRAPCRASHEGVLSECKVRLVANEVLLEVATGCSGRSGAPPRTLPAQPALLGLGQKKAAASCSWARMVARRPAAAPLPWSSMPQPEHGTLADKSQPPFHFLWIWFLVVGGQVAV